MTEPAADLRERSRFRYRTLRPLGAGVSGDVVLALDLFTNDEVALKRFDRGSREQALREAQALLRIHHPGLVAATDVRIDPSDGALVVAFPFVRGSPTTAALRSAPIEEILAVFTQILRAVGVLHRRGFVHRDLKPDNVLVAGSAGQRRAFVIDFGFARRPVPGDAVIAGTLAYMAPEVLEGRAASVRSDLFSIGLMLFEALSGRLPTQGQHGVDAVRTQTAGDFRLPADVAARLPAAIVELVRHLLRRDPSLRPASAVEVLEKLARITGLGAALETLESLRCAVDALEFTGDDARALLDAAVPDGGGSMRIRVPPGAEDEVARTIRARAAAMGRPVVDVRADELRALDVAETVAAIERDSIVLVPAAPADLAARPPRADVLLVLVVARTAPDTAAAVVVPDPSLDEVHRAVSVQVGLEAAPAWLARLRGAAGLEPRAVRAALRLALEGGVLVADRGVVRVDAARHLERLPLRGVEFASAAAEIDRLDQAEARALAAAASTTLPLPSGPDRDRIAPADVWRRLAERGLVDRDDRDRVVLVRDDVATACIDSARVTDESCGMVAAALRRAATDDPVALGEAGRLDLRAGRSEFAVRDLLEAGIRLRRLGRAREARAFLELAAKEPLEPSRRLELARWIADCQYLEGDDDGVLTTIESARALDGDADLRASVAAIEARVLARRGTLDAALACVERALLPSSIGAVARGLLLLTRSHLLKELGLADLALRAADSALEVLPRDAALERASALNVRANALSELSRVEEAVVAYTEAERLARSAGRADLAALAVANHAAIRVDAGQFGRAIAVLEPALAEFRSSGELRHAETLIVTLIGARLARGEIGAARGLAGLARRCFEGGGSPRNAALVQRRLAEVELRAGSVVDATRLLEQAAAAEASVGRELGLALFSILDGRVALWRGERVKARRLAALGLRVLARHRGSDEFLDAAQALAEMHLWERRCGAARFVARCGVSRSRAALKPQRRAQLLVLVAAAERDRGDREAALMLADGAARALGDGADGLVCGEIAAVRAVAYESLGREGDADAAFAVALAALQSEGAAIERARALAASASVRLERARRGTTDGSRAGSARAAGLLSAVRDDLERAIAAQRAAGHVPLGEEIARVTQALDAVAGLRSERGGALGGVERRLVGLERLLDVTKAVNTEFDPVRLLAIMLDAAIELCGARRGFVILVQDDKVEVRAARNFVEQDVQNPEFEISHSVARRVALTGEPIVTSDALRDQRLRSISSIAQLRVLSILCVPLVSHERVLGSLYVDHPDRVDCFDQGHLDLLADFAQVAGIALERARLHRENAERASQLAVANERIERLNRELMDTVAAQAKELVDVKDVLAAERRALANRYDYAAIVSRSAAMREVLGLLDRVTDTNFPVLILGESGTGKELVARALHCNGPRREKAFVSVNCAAMTATLIEAELFGFVRGAFTGAERDREGLFEVAHGGTLFLDEIGDMTLELQSRLLRAIQSGEFFRVGGRAPIHVDVRVIAATHRTLQELIQRGAFREDLYYRLNVAQVRLPPLRERGGDIPLLVSHFAADAARELGTAAKSFTRAALAALERYAWPGNVRELQNEIRRLTALLGDRAVVDVADLSEPMRARRADLPEAVLDKSWKELMDAEERRILAHSLRLAGGNKVEAARRLGITLRGLYKILERHGGLAGLLSDGP
ncbi:MAG: sigma 54-interacting transcriptional regulator [Planctomycetes bacterium]|nr:sigma 54-interacting transcriptional regulator [Planctomycetota bacterium]